MSRIRTKLGLQSLIHSCNMKRFSPKLSGRESLEYTVLWQTLKILQQSQISEKSNDSLRLSSTFSDTFKESHNTGSTDGLPYNLGKYIWLYHDNRTKQFIEYLYSSIQDP